MPHPLSFSRRQALRLGAGALATARLATAATAGSLREVAPGIHVREGVTQDLSAGNGNAIANIGFIIGGQRVAVIDPGGSLADGQALRARIRSLTSLPIAYVIMSHAHPDHIFGAGAFLDDRPQFVAHARLPASLAGRVDYYRERQDAVLGRGSAAPVVPEHLIADGETLELGSRRLVLQAHPVAHSDCDLTVLDELTGTLWLSDLLFVRRVPSLDGSLKGWLAVLAGLKSQSARRVVPGHGPRSVNWPQAANDLERYLSVLQRETRAAFKRGLELNQAVEIVGASERGKWALFDDYHGHNVTQAFKEVEWE